MPRVVIFANGNLPDIEKARAILREDDFIVCADGGTRHASSLRLQPALVIGDLDSAEEATLQTLRADGIAIEQHPRDKDETDLELAIARALEMEPEEIVIVGALGGRLDQTLANIALLKSLQHSTCNLKLDDGVEEILLCRDQSRVHGRSGDIVSLIPWQGAVSGIHTSGLKWSLRDETLYPEKTRGISNEMTGDTASIQVRSGILLIVHRRLS